MKATLHIPTEQFGFTEVELEVESIDEALFEYKCAAEAYKRLGEGLEPKLFNSFLDKYLSGKPVDVNEYEKMDSEQKEVVQHIKRSKARLKRNT